MSKMLFIVNLFPKMWGTKMVYKFILEIFRVYLKIFQLKSVLSFFKRLIQLGKNLLYNNLLIPLVRFIILIDFFSLLILITSRNSPKFTVFTQWHLIPPTSYVRTQPFSSFRTIPNIN